MTAVEVLLSEEDDIMSLLNKRDDTCAFAVQNNVTVNCMIKHVLPFTSTNSKKSGATCFTRAFLLVPFIDAPVFIPARRPKDSDSSDSKSNTPLKATTTVVEDQAAKNFSFGNNRTPTSSPQKVGAKRTAEDAEMFTTPERPPKSAGLDDTITAASPPEENKIGVYLEPGKPFWASLLIVKPTKDDEEFMSLSKNVLSMKILTVALSVTKKDATTLYTGMSKFNVDDLKSPLHRDVFEQFILPSRELCIFPTLDAFPKPINDPSKSTVTLMLPLNHESYMNNAFSKICPVVLPTDQETFTSLSNGNPYVGVSMASDFGRMNRMTVFYRKTDGQKIFMTYNYNYDSFREAFNISNPAVWRLVGGAMIHYARDWFMHGFTSYENVATHVEKLSSKKDYKDNGELNLPGYICEMRVNLIDTVRDAGFKCTKDQVAEWLKDPNTSFKNYTEKNVFYRSYKDDSAVSQLIGKKNTIVNLNEVNDIHLSFMRFIGKGCIPEDRVEFYGIYNTAVVDPLKKNEADPEMLKKRCPDCIFLISLGEAEAGVEEEIQASQAS